MDHPYKQLPERAFWAPAVGRVNCFEIQDLWRPKFGIRPQTPIATFGSCFAQHIGRALRERDYAWVDAEPAPYGLSRANQQRYNYRVFSARTGNIYTTSLLKQWVDWALGDVSPPEIAWEQDGRVYDPFRPTIEPGGFASKEEMLESRRQAIASFADAVRQARVFVFTLGLTESWFDREGWEYPMCPGTVAGEFNSETHQFVNQDFRAVKQALVPALKTIRNANPKLKVLLTVSPVPLTATNSGSHVLVATMHSKSILRAVAGDVVGSRKFVDYFPSYEIINSPAYGGAFFEANKRSVSAFGVRYVMDSFFTAIQGDSARSKPKRKALTAEPVMNEEANCDEELLGAFGERAGK